MAKVNKKIFNAMCCPTCMSANLQIFVNSVTCINCGVIYPIINQQPLMLIEGSLIREWYTSDKKDKSTPFHKFLSKIAMFRPEDRLWSFDARAAIDRLLSEKNPDQVGRLVVCIGSGYEKVFRKKFSKYEGVCHVGLPHIGTVDVIGDAMRLPLQDASVDAMFSSGVFEHINNPELAMQEALRVLKPGGMIYADIPFIRGYHAEPVDYQRYTYSGIETVFARNGFNLVEKGVCDGPFTAAVLGALDILKIIPTREGAGIFRWAFSWILHPLKYIDVLLWRTKGAKYFACNFYYVGMKQSRTESPIING